MNQHLRRKEMILSDLLEGTNARDLVPRMDDCRRTTLGPHQHNVNEIGRRWHGAHLLKVVDRHGDFSIPIRRRQPAEERCVATEEK